VTFHHFTTPRWVAARGGWTEPATAELFARFCSRAAEHLGDAMARACTINEPNAVAAVGWVIGDFPPGHHDDLAGFGQVTTVFVDAHRRAVEAIRAAAPGVPVGLPLSMADWQAVDGAEDLRDLYRGGMEDVYLQATKGDDFVGVQ